MTNEQATSYIDAPPRQIRDVLLSPLTLPDWNEAFLSISGPTQPAVGVQYPLRVRPGLSGHYEYTAIERDRIEASWQVPGFREQGSWVLEPQGPGTLVTHTFSQAGPLAAVLSHAYKGIAAVRLGRLDQRVHGHQR